MMAKKKINRLKMWGLLIVMALFCVACGAQDKDETTKCTEKMTDDETTISIEKITDDETTISSEKITDDESIISTESSSKEEIPSEERTSRDEKDTTTNNENSSENQTTITRPTYEKETKPITQQTTTSKENSETPTENSEQNTKSELDILVESVLSKCIKSSMNQAEKAVAIHDYLTHNVSYDHENYKAGTIPPERYTALGALRDGIAVCDGFAKAFCELASKAELDVKRIIGTANGPNGYEGHAWNQVKIDGVWYNIDATWDIGGSYNYCLISDETLEKDHRPESSDREKCLKDYDGEKLINAIIVIHTDIKAIYISNESEITTELVDFIKKGYDEFYVFKDVNVLDSGELFEEAIAKSKTPFWVNISDFLSDKRFDVDVYFFEIPENAKVITSVDEIKTAIEKYGDNVANFEFWWFDDEFNEGEDLTSKINIELARNGYDYSVYGCLTVKYKKILLYLEKYADGILIKDIQALEDYIQNHTLDEIVEANFIYPEGVSSDDVCDTIAKFLIVNGYTPDYFQEENMSGLTKINLSRMSEVVYVENALQIAEYINKNGIENTVGVYFAIQCDDMYDDYELIRKITVDVSLETGYFLCESFYEYTRYGHAFFYYDSYEEDVAVSGDVSKLKKDIEEAISKGIVDNIRFCYIDKTGNFGGKYNDIFDVVRATGCDVNTRYADGYQYYNMIYLTAN